MTSSLQQKLLEVNSSVRGLIMRSFVFSKTSALARKTVVDLGCGKGAWGRYLPFARGVESAYKVGVEIFRPSIEQCKRIYDEVVIADVAHMPFRERAFDFVFSVFVLEHLEKQQGNLSLKEAERVCRDIFVCVAEHGYKPDEISVPLKALRENPFLHHVSSWKYYEFSEKGFHVRGIGYSRLFKTSFLKSILFPLTVYFPYIFPIVSDKLLAWKHV
jgi:SAM-dependent methyltransferase